MIRLATLRDIPVLVKMVERFVLEEMVNPPEPDPEVIEDTLLLLIQQQNRDGMALVYDVGGVIQGLVLGLAVPSMFSRDITTLEVALYVQPEFRKSRVGFTLLKAYEDWSKDIALADETAVASLNHRLEKIYKRRGYSLIEQSYKRRNK